MTKPMGFNPISDFGCWSMDWGKSISKWAHACDPMIPTEYREHTDKEILAAAQAAREREPWLYGDEENPTASGPTEAVSNGGNH